MVIDFKNFKISIEGYEIPFKIQRIVKNKGTKLQMGTKGLKLSLSKEATDSFIEGILKKNYQWILETARKIYKDINTNKIDESSKLLFNGKDVPIKVTFSDDNKNYIVLKNSSIIEIVLRKNISGEIKEQIIKKGIAEWYIHHGRDIFHGKGEKFSKLLGVSFQSIRLKDQKSRWGSCSNKGSLNFNWRLLMLPEELMDYVIIHELCHLKHMNHSKEFWLEVAKILPDWKTLRSQLHNYSYLLAIY